MNLKEQDDYFIRKVLPETTCGCCGNGIQLGESRDDCDYCKKVICLSCGNYYEELNLVVCNKCNDIPQIDSEIQNKLVARKI